MTILYAFQVKYFRKYVLKLVTRQNKHSRGNIELCILQRVDVMAGGKKSKRDVDKKKDKKRGRDERDEPHELDEYDDEDDITSNLDEKAISNEWSVPTAAAVNVEAKVISINI